MSISSESLGCSCPFCPPLVSTRVVIATGEAIALRDDYPVSSGHTLIVPRRHIADFFDLSEREASDLFKLVRKVKVQLDSEFHPAGYNLGINVGAAAGQTVMHTHLHLIPRYMCDVADPTGGIRNVIPGKGPYNKSTSDDDRSG